MASSANSTNTNAKPPVNLHNLPSDVFTTLTSSFDLSAIATLRQVSHGLHAAATNELFTSCFAYRTTDLGEKSLNNLFNVCRSDFGKYVNCITIQACFYRTDTLAQQVKDKRKWEAAPSNGPIFSSSARSMSLTEVADAKANLQLFQELHQKQAEAFASGKATTMLASAFEALGRHDIDIKLEAVVLRETLNDRLPARGLYGDLKRQIQEIMNNAFKATFTAVSQSQLTVKKLELFDVEQAGHISVDALHDLFASAVSKDEISGSISPGIAVSRQFHDLQHLVLNLSPPPQEEKLAHSEDDQNNPGDHNPAATEEEHIQLTILRELLAACSSTLTHLDIRFRGTFQPHYSASKTLFASLPSLPKLTILHLRNIVLEPHSLISVILSSPKLSHLGLHHISLALPTTNKTNNKISTKSWLPIFSALTHLQHLETFEANGLFLNHFYPPIFPCAPIAALNRIPKNHYTTRIYYEGPTCVTFTGDEVRGTTTPLATPTNNTPAREPHKDDKPTPDYFIGVEWGAATSVSEDGDLGIEEVGTPDPSKAGASGSTPRTIWSWIHNIPSSNSTAPPKQDPPTTTLGRVQDSERQAPPSQAAVAQNQAPAPISTVLNEKFSINPERAPEQQPASSAQAPNQNRQEVDDDELYTPLRYRINKRRPLGSPWLYTWHRRNEWEYGLF